MIRAYRDEDAPEVVRIWNECLAAEAGQKKWFVDEHALDVGILEWLPRQPDFDPDGAFVCERKGRVVGYARSVVMSAPRFEGDDVAARPGYLEGLAVEPALWGQGIGSELLERVESYVRSRGKGELVISRWGSPLRGIAVLPGSAGHAFLAKRGFAAAPFEFRLHLEFEGFVLRPEIVRRREELLREGIVIRYYEPRDEVSFAALMERHFPGWWHQAYRPNLERPYPLPVLIAAHGDDVIGFVGFVHVDSVGHASFSPGVDPRYRGRGIGKVLVNLWADEVKKRGAAESVISTGTTNYAAQRIYFGMGYRPVGYHSSTFRKEL